MGCEVVSSTKRMAVHECALVLMSSKERNRNIVHCFKRAVSQHSATLRQASSAKVEIPVLCGASPYDGTGRNGYDHVGQTFQMWISVPGVKHQCGRVVAPALFLPRMCIRADESERTKRKFF